MDIIFPYHYHIPPLNSISSFEIRACGVFQSFRILSSHTNIMQWILDTQSFFPLYFSCIYCCGKLWKFVPCHVFCHLLSDIHCLLMPDKFIWALISLWFMYFQFFFPALSCQNLPTFCSIYIFSLLFIINLDYC